jgi:hypothetical protein
MLFETTCTGKHIALDWAGPLLLIEPEIERIPARISGVYVLQLFDLESGMYPAFYAGKAQDLKVRLHQHAMLEGTSPDVIAVRSVRNAYFSAAPVAAAALRPAIESALIRLLRPPCNRQVPRIAPVFLNLPPSIPRMSIGDPHVRSCR